MKKPFNPKFLLLSLILLGSCTNTNDEDELSLEVTISVTDFSATIDENPTAGDVIGILNASASTAVLVYTLLSQNPNDAIEISQTGEVLVKEPSVFDFEINQEVTGQVQVSSGSSSEVIAITISINDIAEGSEGLVFNDFIADFDENPSNGDVIGTLSASSSIGPVSFTLVSQTPSGAIEVNTGSGTLEVADGSLFVFVTNPVINAEVEVTDGEETGTIMVTINVVEPPTIWNGAKTTFTKADGADPNQAVNQDRITDNVWITRGNDGGPIFNVQSSANNGEGPGGTEWAAGTTANLASLTFTTLRGALGGGRTSFRNSVGKDLVLHLVEDDIYIDLKFTQWSSGRDGGFAYERSTED